MIYADNETKFACIINLRHPLPLAANAMCHALVGIAARLRSEDADLLDYGFADASATSLVSRHPIVVLQARNAGQLRAAALRATALRLRHNAFAATMFGASAAEQIAQTMAVRFDDADLVALALFGPAADLHEVTRRFSVLRTSSLLGGRSHDAV